jgi:hypothetical protein
MQPHRSNALDGAAILQTVTPGRGVAVSLSWSWSLDFSLTGPRVSRERLHPRSTILSTVRYPI